MEGWDLVFIVFSPNGQMSGWTAGLAWTLRIRALQGQETDRGHGRDVYMSD